MGLPTGPTVTFLFTDIEGSTRLERAVGSAAWAQVVARHDRLVRSAIEGHGGVVIKTEGDAFFAAFDRPAAAAPAAVAAQRAIAHESWGDGVELRIRMGLHIGEGRLRQGPLAEIEDYVGIDVNYAARIAAAGNIILFEHGDPEFAARVAGATFELVRDKGVMLAPVKVLHLPDPGELAAGRFGPERARELLAIGATMPVSQVVADVLAASPPAPSAVAGSTLTSA
jgi:class 3 adenylate cyclase